MRSECDNYRISHLIIPLLWHLNENDTIKQKFSRCKTENRVKVNVMLLFYHAHVIFCLFGFVVGIFLLNLFVVSHRVGNKKIITYQFSIDAMMLVHRLLYNICKDQKKVTYTFAPNAIICRKNWNKTKWERASTIRIYVFVCKLKGIRMLYLYKWKKSSRKFWNEMKQKKKERRKRKVSYVQVKCGYMRSRQPNFLRNLITVCAGEGVQKLYKK